MFVRDDGFGNEPTHSWLRLATASGVTGAWAGSQFATIGINTDPSIETTPALTGHTHVAWLRDGQVAAYLLVLAWRIARSGGADRPAVARPLGLLPAPGLPPAVAVTLALVLAASVAFIWV